jgi:hypothetical protein
MVLNEIVSKTYIKQTLSPAKNAGGDGKPRRGFRPALWALCFKE